MEKILVIMSTYNGEKYLKEQIESILCQHGVEVTLLIRDDGSSDKTPDILKEYESKEPHITCIYGKNFGFRRSFYDTLLQSGNEFDYYAFSDQDDVWMEDKMLNAVNAIKAQNNRIALYATGLHVVDEQLQPMYDNTFKKLRISYGSALSRQRLAGCTMVFTKELADLCRKFRITEEMGNTISHDAAVYYICLLTGGQVIFNPVGDINFRRHQSTVTEHGKGLSKRIGSVLNIFNKNSKRRFMQNKYLYEALENEICAEVRPLTEKILHYKESFGKTLSLAFDKRIHCGLFSVDAVDFFAVLARKY